MEAVAPAVAGPEALAIGRRNPLAPILPRVGLAPVTFSGWPTAVCSTDILLRID
jgi:hypothetical protein